MKITTERTLLITSICKTRQAEAYFTLSRRQSLDANSDIIDVKTLSLDNTSKHSDVSGERYHKVPLTSHLQPGSGASCRRAC